MSDTLREALGSLASALEILDENEPLKAGATAARLRTILAAHPERTVTEWGIDDGYHMYLFQSEDVARAQSTVNLLKFPDLKSDVLHRQVAPWVES